GVRRIGYFARVAPEKGLHILSEAYRILRKDYQLPSLRLEVAGYLAREHESYLGDVQRNMKAWGLESEFQYHGVLDRSGKIQFLQQLDVFSVPVVFDDPKGLPILEAMACGVPVVQPRRGGFPEIQANTSGGLLFEPGDIQGLASALRSVLEDEELARTLTNNGSEGVRRHYNVGKMADRTMTLYEYLQNSRGEALAGSGKASAKR
ncbi:MAG TPA: glycosyltransferase family 4 protein, partial [Terriglobia bacterium]|nr:glycosyltransferase family 4 protein [Terriglobia bacterium]